MPELLKPTLLDTDSHTPTIIAFVDEYGQMRYSIRIGTMIEIKHATPIPYEDRDRRELHVVSATGILHDLNVLMDATISFYYNDLPEYIRQEHRDYFPFVLSPSDSLTLAAD